MAHTSTISLAINEHPLSTIMTIVHPLIQNPSSNIFDTPLNRQELKAIKEKNLVEALKKFMNSRGISFEKSPSSLTAS